MLHVSHIPSTDDHSPRVGIGADLMDDVADLINMPPIACRPLAVRLVSVDRPQFTLFVGPLVPNRDTIFSEVGDAGFLPRKNHSSS